MTEHRPGSEREAASSSYEATWPVALSLLICIPTAITLILLVWPNISSQPTFFGTLTREMRYLLLVMASGMLGGSIHVVAKLYRQEPRATPASLVRGQWHGIITVALGAALGVVGYMALRGTLNPSIDATSVLNPFTVSTYAVIFGFYGAPRLEEATRRLSEQLLAPERSEQQLARIEAALGTSLLDNYIGYVCGSVRRLPHNVLLAPEEDEVAHLSSYTRYELTVWFTPSAPADGAYEQIVITGGRDVERLQFAVTPNSDQLSVAPRQGTIEFGVLQESPRARFQFAMGQDVDPDAQLWIEVTQKNRLIMVLNVPIHGNVT
jgi:hypothetical protein